MLFCAFVGVMNINNNGYLKNKIINDKKKGRDMVNAIHWIVENKQQCQNKHKFYYTQPKQQQRSIILMDDFIDKDNTKI